MTCLLSFLWAPKGMCLLLPWNGLLKASFVCDLCFQTVDVLSFKSMSSPCVGKAMCFPQCCFVCCDIAGSFYKGGIRLFCTLLSTKENIGVMINCFTGQPNQNTRTLLYWCRITRDHHRIEISYLFHGSKMHGSFKEAKNISCFFRTWTTLTEYLCCFVCCPWKTLDIPNF